MSIEVEVKEQTTNGAPASESWHAVVTDRDRNRAWSGTGDTPSTATTRAVQGFLGDRRSTEYVK